MRDFGRILILAGVIIVIAGVLMTFTGRLGVGKLPGDIVVRRGNFTFFFPLMTSIVLSIVVTVLMWLFRRG